MCAYPECEHCYEELEYIRSYKYVDDYDGIKRECESWFCNNCGIEYITTSIVEELDEDIE